MDSLKINGIKLYGNHGITEDERRVGAQYEIDVIVVYSEEHSANQDELSQVVDYTSLYGCVKRAFQGNSFKLIESSADKMAQTVLDEFNPVREVTIRLRKRPPFEASMDLVEVEVSRRR